MGNYMSLSKTKYNGSGPSLSEEELLAEYQQRLNGWSTYKTELFPLLNYYKLEGVQTNKYPIFYVQTSKATALETQINENSRKIKLISGNLPGVAELSYVKRGLVQEIYSTNEIEGVKTNKVELGTVAGEVLNSKRSGLKTKRLESTFVLYHDAIQGRIIKIHSLKDFRTIYDQILHGEINEDDLPNGNLFRNKRVFIGTDDGAIIRHRPPVNEKLINDQLLPLISFMNRDGILPATKAVISHFMFENTHPFVDGNGRMGRYLLSAYLSLKYDMFTGLSISQSIYSNRDRYYNLFKEAGDANNMADLTMFVEGMLKIIRDGQEDVILNLQELEDSLEESDEYLSTNLDNYFEKTGYDEQDKSRMHSIMYVILQSQLFSGGIGDTITLKELSDHLKESLQIPISQTQKLVGLLEKDEIITKVKKRPIQYRINEAFLTKY